MKAYTLDDINDIYIYINVKQASRGFFVKKYINQNKSSCQQGLSEIYKNKNKIKI